MPRRLHELMADAAARIERLHPPAARAAVAGGATLVDIRSFDARSRHGVIPGSLHIPRTVLEWRLEPGGLWRSPYAPELEQGVVVLCDGGYSSVLAAAQLVELGYVRAGDVVGGFSAWRQAGLPWVPAVDVPLRPDQLPGMRPPE